MATFEPVDHDPFAASSVEDGRLNSVAVRPAGQPKFEPVDHDPFAGNVAADVAKSGGIGLAKGAIGTVGAAGDMRELLSAGVDYAGQKFGLDPKMLEQFKAAVYEGAKRIPGPVGLAAQAPSSKNIQGKIEEQTGAFYKPQTTAGEYAQTLGEFAPAAIGGPAGVLRKAAAVAIPAVASETAGQLTKGKQAEPYARFGAALAGGAGAALASRPGSAAQSIRQQLPEGVTPQMVNQAEALMQDAAQQGIRLAWPEALSQVAGRPVLTNAMRHLEASPQTEGRMAEFFAGRPQQVDQAARGQFDQIAPPNNAPSTIGPAVGREAEGHVNDVRGAINAASEPYYTAASTVRIPPAEMARARAVPGYDQAVRAIQRDPQLARYVQGLPEDSVGHLGEVKKWLDQAAEQATSPVSMRGRNMQRSAGFTQDAATAREVAVRASPDYDTALAIQAGGREQILQPILDGPIGKLASKDTTTRKAIEVLFPADPLANSQDEIGRAVQTLANRSPRVASDLVRAHVEEAFNRSAKDLQTGPNQAGGAKFRAQLVGNPQQAANLEAAVTALPNGQQRWDGFNRFLEVLEATGTRQNVGSRTAYNAEINKAQAMGGVTRDVAKVGLNPMKALQPIVDRYDQWKLGRNLNQLARILTDPAAAGQLRAIARMPQGSNAATSMALKLITYGEASK
jgi:hypothetical protein